MALRRVHVAVSGPVATGSYLRFGAYHGTTTGNGGIMFEGLKARIREPLERSANMSFLALIVAIIALIAAVAHAN